MTSLATKKVHFEDTSGTATPASTTTLAPTPTPTPTPAPGLVVNLPGQTGQGGSFIEDEMGAILKRIQFSDDPMPQQKKAEETGPVPVVQQVELQAYEAEEEETPKQKVDIDGTDSQTGAVVDNDANQQL